MLVEDCRRFNITNCTILDCDNVGLLMRNVSLSRVSDCLIRDDRPKSTSGSIEITGGKGNMIIDNLLGSPPRISDHEGIVRDNAVIP